MLYSTKHLNNMPCRLSTWRTFYFSYLIIPGFGVKVAITPKIFYVIGDQVSWIKYNQKKGEKKRIIVTYKKLSEIWYVGNLKCRKNDTISIIFPTVKLSEIWYVGNLLYHHNLYFTINNCFQPGADYFWMRGGE